MQKKLLAARVLIICILILSLLLSVALFALLRQDLIFLMMQQIHHYDEFSFSVIDPIENGVKYSLNDLKKQKNTIVSSVMMLVNSSHPLPQNFEVPIEIYNGAEMHPLMVDSYIALRDAVLYRTGVRIYVADDYRTREEQEEILAESEQGIAAAVGCSEHEAGLALDVYAPYFAGEEFLKSAAGREVNRICGEYGFIIRYPNGKEEVTGISYEPWHLRYVGMPHSKIMMDCGIVLEEYLERLPKNKWIQYNGYLILHTFSDSITMPQKWESCHISSDNAGGTLITLKMN